MTGKESQVLGRGCIWGGLAGYLLSLPVMAHEAHTEYAASPLAVSVTANASGQLWLAQVKKGQILVSHSAAGDQPFGQPVVVNSKPMRVAADGEARPKIAVAANGHVYVSWTESLKTPYAGYIWFARSIDQGQSFEAPQLVHQDRAEITHRFDALQVSPDGTITVVWVDKRDLLAAKAAGKPYDGAALYYAVSTDQGKSFAPEQKLADSSCECCRIATTVKPDGTVGVLWRHVFAGSERDHAMAEIRPAAHSSDVVSPALVRASFGRWKIDGCPHHGAALAVGAGFGYHLAYFDGAGDKPGLRLARMDDQAWVTSPPKRVGDSKKMAGHPTLYSVGDKVWLAWREQSTEGMEIWSMLSNDGGKNWNTPSLMARSAAKLDYPQWVNTGKQLWLLFHSADKGLQRLPFNL